jgi:hypothetical protein
VLRPSSPVCAKASPRRPCYTLDRSAFVPCPEKNPGMRSDLSVFRINRSCKPANPAFTMSENFRRTTTLKGHRSQTCVSVVTAILSAIISEWWSRSGSNRRPQACKARALPTELRPHGLASIRLPIFPRSRSRRWWARDELNVRPHAYQACALTT